MRSTRAIKFSGREGGLLSCCVCDVLFSRSPAIGSPPVMRRVAFLEFGFPVIWGSRYLCSVYYRGSGSVSIYIALLLGHLNSLFLLNHQEFVLTRPDHVCFVCLEERGAPLPFLFSSCHFWATTIVRCAIGLQPSVTPLPSVVIELENWVK